MEERVFDDYQESIVQGEHTYQIFLHAFDIKNKDSINRGALALWWVMRLLVQADLVLQGMNWDRSRDYRFGPRPRSQQQKRVEYIQRQDAGRGRPE